MAFVARFQPQACLLKQIKFNREWEKERESEKGEWKMMAKMDSHKPFK